MRIFETHAHLDFNEFDKDRDQLFNEFFNNGIEKIINIGVGKESSLNSIKLAEKYEQVYAAIGFHPSEINGYDEDFIIKNISHRKVVAVGEIGLDYYRMHFPKKEQQNVFSKQVELAIKFNKPIIIHDREAHDDCFAILKNKNAKNVVFHCFSGDENFAEKILGEGWIISFTGTITYKKSKLENVIRIVPKDKFFIETDSPYLSPVPKRGKRNSPLNLRYIIDKISELKQVSPKMVAEMSFHNAEKFFFKNLKK
jgi:TatD DNase family protein